jgi:RNA-binding protein YlmH
LKPYLHSKSSVKRWGGKVEDYLPIHNFLDISKSAHPDMRHRALLHNSLGCYIAEQMFGDYIINSDRAVVSVRDIAEEHILEDLGRIPTVSDYLDGMPMYDWLGGPKRKHTFIPFKMVD